jgi:hypothetical protein
VGDQPPATNGSRGTISLENQGARVVLSRHTGAIVQIENRERQLQLVTLPSDGVPWRIEILEPDGSSSWLETFTSFEWHVTEADNSVHLAWTTDPGMVVEADVRVPRGTSDVAFSIAVNGVPGVVIDKVEYPIVTGIGDLHPTADSVLVHSQATGFLFRRPYHLFETGQLRRQGLRYSPYPEGYNGSTMQFMTYYAQDVGGFLMRTADPAGGLKWFNFFKAPAGSLECSFMHQAPDLQPGASLVVPYPVLFEPTREGTWYEAAERYKRWAVEQPWTGRGTLAERDVRPTWLLDDVGFATFGVNAAHDRSRWLDRFHRITDQPVFHVLGVNWPRESTKYGKGHPGGRDDWFPARFSRENLSTIGSNGDYWAPFEFDLLLDEGKSESELVLANRLRLPEQRYSFDSYPFPYQCPASTYLPPLHAWRDATLCGEYGADALYYDISAPNVLMACRNPGHGHPIGGGGWMVDAVGGMWERTGRAAADAKGSHVPQGAEMVHELFIPYLDFYQARAEACPLSIFEADVFRDWIRSGDVEKIPLFAYVYHEYGPIRMDGWAKLSRETGDLFYWVASRVALWGGLFELNYEFSDLEAFPDAVDEPSEHYAEIVARAFEVDPAKVAFVREIALARTGYARPWFVYGTMVRPLDLTVPRIGLEYHLYNAHDRHPNAGEHGTKTVESVVHAAWRGRDGAVAFAFVNLDGDRPQTLGLEIDPKRYGFTDEEPLSWRRLSLDGRTELLTAQGHVTLEITLPPRKITLIDMRPSDLPGTA